MQASAEASTFDLQAMQSMEWLFRKERIYLLMQFWQQKASLAEKEVTALKEQLAAANDGNSKTEGQNLSQNPQGAEQSHDSSNPRRTPNSNLEQELQTKDKEISQLVDEISRLQQSLQRLQESSSQAAARLEDELEARRQHISRLESKLEKQKDYDDLKREISVLRSVDLSQIPTGEPGKSLEHLLMERSKALQQAENLKPPNTPDNLGGLSSPLQRAATASPHGAVNAPPVSLVTSQTTLPTRSTPTPSSATSTSSSLLFPPPLQNVETFGSFLGEEIVANWRRSLEKTIMSQQQPQQTSQASQQQQAQSTLLGLHPPSTPSNLNHLPSPTDPIMSSNTPGKSSTPLGSLDATEKALTPIPGHETPAPPTPSSTALTSPPATIPPPTSTADSTINGSFGNLAPTPKSPAEESCNNNNSHHLTNNNIGALSVLDSLKGPFRFDDRTHPFRFGDEFGAAGMAGRLGESLIPKGDPMEARLQEMLRYNMDKYASQNLDTLNIARRVRELLSIHNIGQRLFAKYVLGLSQGTVSELLSKPKPWDKLTEKGRDSYRKMHGWACDDNAVMLLKSLIPKKGKEQGMPAFARGPQDGPPDMSDERFAHILSESGHLQIRGEHEVSNDADSKSPSRVGCPSPFSKDRLDSQNRRLKKYENDDIPQEKVVRIYQEELAKLMGRRVDDLRGPRDFLQSGTPGLQGMERTQEEIRLALDAYHRELQKLNVASGQNPTLGGLPLSGLPSILLQQQALQQHHLATNGGVVQDLSLGKLDPRNKMMNGVSDEEKEKMEEAMRHAGSAFSLVRPKQEPIGPQSTPGGSSASSPLGNSILPPAMTPSEEFAGAAAASPLQRMASITNSLISQPSTPTHHSANQRPLKAVLPPITQQQFDMYNNLNTEDIVKRVKEQLSQYSISQRLFGESVLGLSQGSVSDLLARPKPWHMLTQKGREPFIRMKMFLEDDNAVHKLVASQYKIAPEKLMRTGGYGGLPPCGTPMKPMPPTKLVQEQLQNAAKAQAAVQAAAQAAAQHQQESQMQLGPPPQNPQHSQHPQHPQPPPPMMLTPSGPLLPHSQLNMQELQKKQQQQQQQISLHSPHHQMAPSPLRSLHPHISPSVYEMAALTQDLDTQTITTKIKEALLANNIGQKIFGEAVLGLSQGSVSELLSKPKPWHMLSIKGREPFIRMQLWLSDAHNVDRLQALKNERREANKRRRSSGPGHDNSSDTSSNDTAEFYHSASPGPGPTSAKKQRVLFSEEQKEALRLAFALDPYPNVSTIEFLAGELSLSSRTITNWFHNHRMRLKQQPPHGQPEPQSPREPGQPFDAVQFRLMLNQKLLEIQKERLCLGNVPMSYPPYFNPNLAALVGNALKEQCSGLDLSMGSLKREPMQEFEDEDDAMSNLGSEDSEGSAGSIKREPTEAPAPTTGRSSRRKPAAPQWVNPEWQEPTRTGDEVIINGVCVMQTDDYGVKRENEETVRVEPTPVQDRFDEDAQSDVSSVSGNNAQDRDSPLPSPKSGQTSPITSPRPPSVQQTQQLTEESPKDVVKHEPEETWDY